MFLHGIQDTTVDIVVLHTGAKLNLLIATEEGITTSLGGRGNWGEYNILGITLLMDKFAKHAVT